MDKSLTELLAGRVVDTLNLSQDVDDRAYLEIRFRDGTALCVDASILYIGDVAEGTKMNATVKVIQEINFSSY